MNRKADFFRFDGSAPCHIQDLPTGASKKEKAAKEKILAKTEKNMAEMATLQDALYADGREGLVVVLQALDAAGKDSTVKHVMTGFNPQGVTVHSFKRPSEDELAHDYLRRVVLALPRRGEIAIFNRSHYEDVLVVKVHDMQHGYRMANRVIDDEKKTFFAHRYRQIRDFEEYLYENSYRVVKIFLNVSPDEQKERLLARIDDPTKNWKFESGDLKERELWSQYIQAFDDAITETATEHSPWYALPADQKWYTRYLVSEIMVNELKKCCHQYPQLSKEDMAELTSCRAALMAQPAGTPKPGGATLPAVQPAAETSKAAVKEPESPVAKSADAAASAEKPAKRRGRPAKAAGAAASAEKPAKRRGRPAKAAGAAASAEKPTKRRGRPAKRSTAQ